MDNVFIGLGGNIGDPERLLRQVMQALGAIAGTHLVATSSLYRSTPVGKTDQPDFINAVAQLSTSLTPQALLAALHDIEQRHGRVRHEKNGPRTIDLDILLYDDLVLEDPGITLPHPRMHQRAFVLLPLTELAPRCIIPGHGPAMNLLSSLPDQGVIQLGHT